MSVSWGNLERDSDAWELAKKKMNVTNVLSLNSEQFRDLIALAQSIKEGSCNVEKL